MAEIDWEEVMRKLYKLDRIDDYLTQLENFMGYVNRTINEFGERIKVMERRLEDLGNAPEKIDYYRNELNKLEERLDKFVKVIKKLNGEVEVYIAYKLVCVEYDDYGDECYLYEPEILGVFLNEEDAERLGGEVKAVKINL